MSTQPSNDKRLWLVLALVVGGAFFLLGFFGREIYRQAPPLPERTVELIGVVLDAATGVRLEGASVLLVREDRGALSDSGVALVLTRGAEVALFRRGGLLALPFEPEHPVYQRGVQGLAELPAWAGSPLRRRGILGLGPATHD